MDPRLEDLDVPFSTADVGSLSVAAYKWDERSFESIDARPDRVYRVRDSEWVRRWPASAGLDHFALGFRGLAPVPTGYIEVIAKAMEQKTAS